MNPRLMFPQGLVPTGAKAADMTTAKQRGQPLVAIVSLLAGYTVLRTAFWTPLFEAVPPLPSPSVEPLAGPITPLRVFAHGSEAPEIAIPARPSRARFIRAERIEPSFTFGEIARTRLVDQAPSGDPGPRGFWPIPIAEPSRAMRESLLVAGTDFRTLPIFYDEAAYRPASRNRISGDVWIFNRAGNSPSALVAPALATYGASQAGAVLRYALAPEEAARPELYGRLVAALQVPTQQDVALGVSAQPVASLPLRFHAEARVTRQGEASQRETLVRPAVFATTGFYSDDRETGLTARGYAQAGYVGGQSATAFADAQIVGERAVARFDLGEISIGAGAWGGVQRGAGRLDIGPSASVALRLGRSPVWLSADYRFRIAGDAQPGSGAAVTLSTGF